MSGAQTMEHSLRASPGRRAGWGPGLCPGRPRRTLREQVTLPLRRESLSRSYEGETDFTVSVLRVEFSPPGKRPIYNRRPAPAPRMATPPRLHRPSPPPCEACPLLTPPHTRATARAVARTAVGVTRARQGEGESSAWRLRCRLDKKRVKKSCVSAIDRCSAPDKLSA